MSDASSTPGRNRIYGDFAATTGDTPLVRIPRLKAKYGVDADLLMKCEFFNPGGSVKDRIGVAMVEALEQQGVLVDGSTIVEPTSGNTGISLPFVAASKGYRCVLTMPETMSIERVRMIEHLGAEVVLTPKEEGIGGAFTAADRLTEEIDGAVQAGQFVNPANPEIHRRTTALEIWNDTGGKVDIFISGVGTAAPLPAFPKSSNSAIPTCVRLRSSRRSAPCSRAARPVPGT